ncbi:carbon monoxide dehydrogenase subunit G [Acuticoccus sp. MNP-M23]|uniref:CoxG family protein n=1 Tax=Acuticoccus sp. MNP-M23 TaxID=3072793 RepID=UPI002815E441|nr:carbon monoxide dehydrogenase subunit G [Acuticoccus sp. MNP-M23]WMS40867.1 carbon monoxide dehydrogenase subunit G [Acuticoccus sp. MNP-M23]
MELTGEHRIPAPRETVWKALHDPEILQACVKGCKELTKISDDELAGKVEAKVGPVKATFDAVVKITDPVAPERYTLVGEGKGGVAGFAKGSAEVVLAEDGDDTILTYNAKANIGGKLAQLGSRLVDSTARKYAADFFQNLSEILSKGAEPEPAVGDPVPEDPVAAAAAAPAASAPPPAAPAPTAADAGSAEKSSTRIPPLVWLGVLVALGVVLAIAVV